MKTRTRKGAQLIKLFLLTLVAAISLCISISAAAVSADTVKSKELNDKISNGAYADVSKQLLENQSFDFYYNDYQVGVTDKVSPVSQFQAPDGTMYLAYEKNSKLVIRRLNTNLTFTTIMSVKYEMEMVGTVVTDGTYFYVVWGESGDKEKDAAIKIVKYSSTGKVIKSVSFSREELNSVSPFDAGNCDAKITNGKLYCLFSTLRFDGHQYGVQVVVKTSDMSKPVYDDSFYFGESNNDWGYSFWCSHSFAQRVYVDKKGKPWYAMQGDAYPRGFLVVGSDGEYMPFHFYCDKQAWLDYNMWVVNVTNAHLGNIADTSKGVFLVSTSVKTGEAKGFSDQPMNIFIASADGKTKLSNTVSRKVDVYGNDVTDTGIKWLTNYSGEKGVDIVHAVPTNDDKIVLLYNVYDNKNYSDKAYYMVLDSKGNIWQKPTYIPNASVTACETPMYKDGYLYWAGNSTDDSNSYYSQNSKSYIYKLKIGSVITATAPKNVKSAVSKSKTTAKIAWDKCSNAKGIIIEQYKGGKWVQLAKLKGSATSYTVKGLTSLKDKVYSVRAYSTAYGASVKSDRVKVVLNSCSGVTNLKLSNQKYNALTLSWKYLPAADGYIIEMYKDKKWQRIATLNSRHNTSYTKTGLKQTTNYKFRVKAYFKGSKKNYYSSYKNVSGYTVIPAVTGLKHTARTSSTITLGWNKNDSATGYIVEMYKDGKWVRVKKYTKNTSTAFEQTELSPATLYKFRVKGYNTKNKQTFYSGYTYYSVITRLDTVSGFKLKSRSDTSIELCWNKNKSAAGYVLEWEKDGKWERITKITNNKTTSYTVYNLSLTSTYNFRIKSYVMSGKQVVYSTYEYLTEYTAPDSISYLYKDFYSDDYYENGSYSGLKTTQCIVWDCWDNTPSPLQRYRVKVFQGDTLVTTVYTKETSLDLYSERNGEITYYIQLEEGKEYKFEVCPYYKVDGKTIFGEAQTIEYIVYIDII